jgi:hypothetical protein
MLSSLASPLGLAGSGLDIVVTSATLPIAWGGECAAVLAVLCVTLRRCVEGADLFSFGRVTLVVVVVMQRKFCTVCRELIQLRMAWQRHPGLLPELCSESVVPNAWGGVPTFAQLMVGGPLRALCRLFWFFECRACECLCPFSSFLSASLADIRRWLPL